MSYEASAELFFGIMIPDHSNPDLDEREVENAEYRLITYGNFVVGPVSRGIAMITYRVYEGDCRPFPNPQIPEEEILEFKKYLSTLGLENETIGWYHTSSYS